MGTAWWAGAGVTGSLLTLSEIDHKPLRQTRQTDLMLAWCWPSVTDGGQASAQYRIRISCLWGAISSCYHTASPEKDSLFLSVTWIYVVRHISLNIKYHIENNTTRKIWKLLHFSDLITLSALWDRLLSIYSRQILTSNVNPRSERVNNL